MLCLVLVYPEDHEGLNDSDFELSVPFKLADYRHSIISGQPNPLQQASRSGAATYRCVDVDLVRSSRRGDGRLTQSIPGDGCKTCQRHIKRRCNTKVIGECSHQQWNKGTTHERHHQA